MTALEQLKSRGPPDRRRHRRRRRLHYYQRLLPRLTNLVPIFLYGKHPLRLLLEEY
jgi:hypothetical protein